MAEFSFQHRAGVRICIVLFGVITAQGCATTEQFNRSRVGATDHVRIQICLPTKIVKFDAIVLDRLENHPNYTHYSAQQLDLAPKTVRRLAPSSDPRAIKSISIPFEEVRNRSGIFSQGGGSISLRDSTMADQPVFEAGHTFPAKDYIAFNVNAPDPRPAATGRVNYWYVLPKDIPVGVFSKWLKPVAMELEGQKTSIGWTLVHGGKLLTSPVIGDPPRMRASLAELPKHGLNPRTDELPALTTARKKFRKPDSGPDFVYEFVEQSEGVIPDCR